MSIDPKDFRRALGKFPTGVTVITTQDAQGELIGVTASSFNSVSIDPALVLWSIDKGAYSLDAFTQGEAFTVHVLRDDQVDLSNRFARRGEDKFAGVDLVASGNGAPRLADAAAWFECRTWNVYEGGDHFILVGEVTDYAYQDNVGSLVFHNGHYAIPEIHPCAQQVSVHSDVGLNNCLLYLLRIAVDSYARNFYPLLTQFGISVEGWRIVTLLADRGEMSLAALSECVMQPVDALGLAVDRLSSNQWVSVSGERITLTASGKSLADKLFSLARNHEEKIMGSLTVEQQLELKKGLGTIIDNVKSI